MDSLDNGNLWLIVAKLKALVMSRKTTLTSSFYQGPCTIGPSSAEEKIV